MIYATIILVIILVNSKTIIEKGVFLFQVPIFRLLVISLSFLYTKYHLSSCSIAVGVGGATALLIFDHGNI